MWSHIYYDMPIFFDRNDYNLVIYDRRFFERAVHKLDSLMGVGNILLKLEEYDIRTSDDLVDLLNIRYSTLSPNSLKKLFTDQALLFYATLNEREDLHKSLFCKGDNYWVYDLSTLT